MKQLRLALILSALALCTVHAQRDSEPIPDFSNLDEFIYEPKTTLSFGVRALSGGKTSFQGHGKLTLPLGENPGDLGTNTLHIYHDGAVSPDNRGTFVNNGDGTTTTVTNADGTTTVVDNGDATFTFVPIDPDGKTAVWNFTDDRQATEVPGFIAMHSYSAEMVDTRIHSQDGKGTMGMELAVARDMGKIFGTRFTWSLSVGMTINDIAAERADHVKANITKTTDLYSLDGATAPAAPYNSTSPPTTTVNVVDADGNPVFNDDGTNQTTTISDPPILLVSTPASRTATTSTDEVSATTRSRLKGAYYTFRAGPTLWAPITNHLRASVSFGATLVYAGANYAVSQSFVPDTGTEISDLTTSDSSRLLPGYYADATMQFDITPRTGFYAGAVFQDTGDYNQTLNSDTASYSAKVAFGHQRGFRAGMTIKF